MTDRTRVLVALDHVEAGSVCARSDRLRCDAGHGVTARTTGGADLPLVRESGGRVALGGYLRLPAALPSGAGPWTLQVDAQGNASWV